MTLGWKDIGCYSKSQLACQAIGRQVLSDSEELCDFPSYLVQLKPSIHNRQLTGASHPFHLQYPKSVSQLAQYFWKLHLQPMISPLQTSKKKAELTSSNLQPKGFFVVS